MTKHSTLAPEINRRRFLLNTTMAGAAVAVAAPVVAAEPEIHPLARLHALHDEASKLMVVHNEHLGGEWELRIRAPSASHPVVYKNLDAEMTSRDQAIWYMRELERLAKEDGARSAMVTVVGRFWDPDFECRTLMIDPRGVFIDFERDEGRVSLFAPKGGAI
ncbi:hypothetical protein [Mesorhizobium sp. Root552]|uniref:hypothetical protein n=1 Tax=Mesorhizobium sp. Root552 TaxID=1736555 RepID=UPI000B1DB940|nr:hypothetical protein [Mesorhizobium sp. Root552]